MFGQITQSGVTSLVSIGLAIFNVGKGGLIIGTLIGQFSSSILIAARSRIHFTQRPSVQLMLNNASLYRKFPTVQLPATFIEASSAHAPIFLLSLFFGAEVVGFYALSQRVVRMPISMISGAVADVFRQKAGQDFVETGDARQIFRETFTKLLLVSVIPFGLFFTFAPFLFGFIFGHNWQASGEYARILTPMFWMSFVVGPVSSMFMIAQKQEYDLAIQVFLIIASVTALFVGHSVYKSPQIALILFTIVYCTKYCIELYFAYSFTLKRNAIL